MDEQQIQTLGLDTFELRDRWGEEHSYVCHLHEPLQAMGFALRVAKAGGVPLGRLIESNLGILVREFTTGGTEDEKAENLKQVFLRLLRGEGDEKLKLDLPQGVDDIVSVLIELNDEQLLAEVMRQTSRDGLKLNTVDAFNSVYRGNYAEMRKAMTEVVLINGFLDFLFGGWTDNDEEAPSKPTSTAGSSAASESSTASSTGSPPQATTP